MKEEEVEEEVVIELIEKRQNDIVTMLAGVWSDTEFVSSTNWSRHVYVTRMLIRLLSGWMACDAGSEKEKVKEKVKESGGKGDGDDVSTSSRFERSGALNYLLSGVQHHLEHGVKRVRILGMKVARAFSLLLDGDDPLTFHELEEEEERERQEKERERKKEQEEQQQREKEEREREKEREEQQHREIFKAPSLSGSDESLPVPSKSVDKKDEREEEDPDELVQFGGGYLEAAESSDEDSEENISGDSDSDDDDDDDDDLIPYDMEDEHDATAVSRNKTTARRPVYARDLITLIETSQREEGKECYDAYEMWTRTVMDVVATPSDDLRKHVLPLVACLMATENKYGDDHFGTRKHEALVDALVSTTNVDHDLKCSGFTYLIQQLYANNYGISYRRNVLLIIQDAARKLSALVDEEEEDNNNNGVSSSRSSRSSRSSDLLLPLRFPCGTVTKQFHQRKKKITTENRFGPIVCRVFYPLVARFDVRTKQLDLIGRDCLLLVELIRTLAMVLEVGASQRHEIMGMCGVMLDVVCSLRKKF